MADIDDGSIGDDAGLLRRVHPDQVIFDQNLNQKRPSSGAFDDLELSVDSEPLVIADGRDWRSCLANHSGYSLVRFLAGVARGLQLPVIHKPITEIPENPAHCEVHGKKTPGKAKALWRASTWVHLEQ